MAYSGVRARSGEHDDNVARATRAMTSRVRVTIDAIMVTITFYCMVAMGRCYGPISLTPWWILLIFGRQTDMVKTALHTKDRDHSPNNKRIGIFLLNRVTAVWLPWKPMPLGPFLTPPRPSHRV